MLLLGVDVETTGLSFENDKITELGMVLYDTELNMPVKFYDEFVKCGMPIPEEIVKLTGITDELVVKYGVPAQKAMQAFIKFSYVADYIVAHNAPFDRGMIEAELKVQKFNELADRHWIDTSVDVPYPPGIKTRKLQHLGPDHGFLNPWSHRAVFDVLSMLKVLSFYDINDVARVSKEPNVTLMAVCEKPWEDNGVSTGKAKEVGFRWNGDKKKWLKIVKKSQVENELKNQEVKIQIVEEA